MEYFCQCHSCPPPSIGANHENLLLFIQIVATDWNASDLQITQKIYYPDIQPLSARNIWKDSLRRCVRDNVPLSFYRKRTDEYILQYTYGSLCFVTVLYISEFVYSPHTIYTKRANKFGIVVCIWTKRRSGINETKRSEMYFYVKCLYGTTVKWKHDWKERCQH